MCPNFLQKISVIGTAGKVQFKKRKANPNYVQNITNSGGGRGSDIQEY